MDPGWILDPKTGKRIGRVCPGDSFVDYVLMQEHAERIPDPHVSEPL